MPVIQINKSKVLWLAVFMLTALSCEKNVDKTGFFTEDMFSISKFLEDNQDEYSLFYKLVEQSNLLQTLNAYNPSGIGFTLFLPTDAALSSYIENNDRYASFDDLLNDEEFTWILCRYHLLNRSVRSSDFPYGSLPDTTSTGDILTISINVDSDSTAYLVNSVSPILTADIESINGYIHIIGEVLQPIIYDSYEWLKENEGFTILSAVFELSGLKDTLKSVRLNTKGELVKNNYTILAEHDSVYRRHGINNQDDLIARFATPGLEYTDPQNLLYQFAAFHILEGRYYLDEFNYSGNYNSYAIYPVTIDPGLSVKINTGVDTFNIVIEGQDSIYIDYITMYLQQSNINTKTGPIHFISEVMELYQPERTERIFEFLEEPQILAAGQTAGNYEFLNPTTFESISWSGVEKINYTKFSGNSSGVSNNDILEISGKFIISYQMPKILPGLYKVELHIHSKSNNNATIKTYIDEKRMGSSFDLSSGGTTGDPYISLYIGTVEFDGYEEHNIELTTLIPGNLKWDYVRFIPE